MAGTGAGGAIFRRAVVAWLILGLCVLLFSASLEGLLPEAVFMTLPWVLYIAPLLALLAIAMGLWLRRRATWRTPLGALGAIVVVAAAVVPFDYLSVRLNFWLHKPIYDSIVRDALAGRQIGASGPDGRRQGVRRGVNYSFHPQRPLVVSFQWKTSTMTIRMVEYHEHPTVCPPPPKARPEGPDPETFCVEWPSLGDGYVFWQGIV
ncbi:MAG: hypothetical protein KKE02_00350 [Alphaproteobacteria bacterium]|nr:hypothetical protein [Alphaproteobacteria bacterium]MBU1514896.1 hypothetical protein [Alphaproteobacteria bacterium]MBU2093817.1 hypothetical protein [Alphaproteobacteria bacterium]MBU2149438.1 hypothetical protein [Alphaproteobacteria bacterium]MBU2305398.1 hypothetical protein [Alphaproteobacteria bacterium]